LVYEEQRNGGKTKLHQRLALSIIQNLFDLNNQKKILWEGLFIFNELPRRKQRSIKNFKFCHSALSAGMTNSPQAAGYTTRRD